MSFSFKKYAVTLALILLALALLSCTKAEPSPSPSATAPPAASLSPAPATSPAAMPPAPPVTSITPNPVTPAAPSPVLRITSPPVQSPAPVTTPVPSPSPASTALRPSPPASPTLSRTSPALEIVASGLDVPWALAFAPDGRLFFTERPGRVRVIQQGRLLDEPVARLDAAAVSEAGLMGLAVDPAFQTNGYIYVQYTYRDAGGMKNRVERLTIRDNKAVESKVLIEGIPGNTIHDGSRLKFGPDGKLYITAGDAANTQLSQELASPAGKILRLNPDGSIPSDNPFPGSPVFSYGHRNPQGIAWQPQTGILFSTEHGSSAHDELNIIRPGGNYGWPLVRGQETAPGMISPLLESGEDTWAPSGMTFYQGAAFPQWQGNLFFTALRGQHLHRLVLSGQEITQEERLFQGELGRLRDVIDGPDGFLYFTTNNRDGRGVIRAGDDHIYRLVPK